MTACRRLEVDVSANRHDLTITLSKFGWPIAYRRIRRNIITHTIYLTVLSHPLFSCALHTLVIEFYSRLLDITSLLSISLYVTNCGNAHCINFILALQILQQTPQNRSLRPILKHPNPFHRHPAQLLLVPVTPLTTSIRSTTHSHSSPTRSSNPLATHQPKPQGSHCFPQSRPSRLPHCPEQAQPAITGPTLYDPDL